VSDSYAWLDDIGFGLPGIPRPGSTSSCRTLSSWGLEDARNELIERWKRKREE
jgi:hypothetical protein